MDTKRVAKDSSSAEQLDREETARAVRQSGQGETVGTTEQLNLCRRYLWSCQRAGTNANQHGGSSTGPHGSYTCSKEGVVMFQR